MVHWHLMQSEVRVWGQRNFPGADPDPKLHLAGVVEEVGELCHASLKLQRKIRGTTVELEAKAGDAIGDVMVFLLSYCNMIDVHYDRIHTSLRFRAAGDAFYKDAAHSESARLMAITRALGDFAHAHDDFENPNWFDKTVGRVVPSWSAKGRLNRAIEEFVRSLMLYCAAKNWSLDKLVEDVWSEVSKRDWVKNPQTGRAA